MELHPQMRRVVAMMAGPDLGELKPSEARAVHRERFQILNQPMGSMRRVLDLYPQGPGGPVPMRVLVPITAATDEALPIMLYFHGGGWVLGSHETVEPQCRYIANASKAIVISVEYRVAPEHKFPAAVDDCLWAVRWAYENAEEFGGDRNRIAVAGDSAGGNLAAVAAQQLRDSGPSLAAQILLFPVTKMIFDTPSYIENAKGPFLTRKMMDWFAELYLNNEAERRDVRVSPLFADNLSGLPPATVVTASHDPLRDEGIAYAERLAEAGVETRHRNWDGYSHAFASWGGYIDDAFEVLDFCVGGLCEVFYGPSEPE
jgi:acetyl esterase